MKQITHSDIELMSVEELKVHIGTTQSKLKKAKGEIDTALIDNFVLAKYSLVSKLSNNPLSTVLQKYPELNLVGTTQQGKIEYFGFSENIQSSLKKSQHALVTTITQNHNELIFNTLQSKYPDLQITQLSGTILPPQKLENNLSDSNATTSTKSEKPTNLNKIGKIMDLLDMLGKQKGLIINHIYLTKHHDKTIMRETDYVAVHVTIDDHHKTIMINDEYGESSFVVDEHIDEEALMTLDKSYYNRYEVHYDAQELDWLTKIKDNVLFGIKTPNSTILDTKTEPINIKAFTPEQYKTHYKDIFDKDCGGIGKLGLLKRNEIRSIIINGSSIRAIASSTGFDTKKYDVKNPQGFKEFLKHLYDVSDEEYHMIYKNYYKDIFNKDYGGIGKLGLLKRNEITSIIVDGLCIRRISTKIGFDAKKYDVRIPQGFKEFLKYLYDTSEEKYDELLKQYVKMRQIENKNHYKEILDKDHGGIKKLRLLKNKDIIVFKVKKIGVGAIASSTGFDTKKYDVKSPQGFKKFLKFLYDLGDIEYTTLYKDYYKNIFDKDHGGIIKLGLLKYKDIEVFKIKKIGVTTIASKTGFDTKKYDVKIPQGFKKFLKYLYDLSDEGYEQMVREYLNKIQLQHKNHYKEIFDKNHGGIIELGLLKKEEIHALKIDKLGVTAIALKTGFDTKKCYVPTPQGFKKFLQYLYDLTEEEFKKLIQA